MQEREVDFLDELESLAKKAKKEGEVEVFLYGSVTADFCRRAMEREAARADITQALLEQFLEESGYEKKLEVRVERDYADCRDLDTYKFVKKSDNGVTFNGFD